MVKTKKRKKGICLDTVLHCNHRDYSLLLFSNEKVNFADMMVDALNNTSERSLFEKLREVFGTGGYSFCQFKENT